MSFARLCPQQGKYALLLNRGQLRHYGVRVLSPIGGGLEVQPTGRRILEGLGAQFEDPGSNELRFWVPDNQVTTVTDWFRTGFYRERGVLRELTEELVDETGILTRAALQGVTENFIRPYRHNDTTRRDVADKRTAYLIDVFSVRPPAGALQALRAAASLPPEQRWLYFVTANEIRSGRTRDGVQIGPICNSLLTA